MSKYFEQIELEFTEDPNIPEKSKPVKLFDLKKLKVAEELICVEMGKIRRGTSKFTHYAIEPGSFGFPAANTLKIFMDDPTEDNYEGFKEIAIQDFGALAGNHFMGLIDEAREDTDNE